MAHVRQSGPESGLDFQIKVLKTFQVVPSSLGSGGGAGRPDARVGRGFLLKLIVNLNELRVDCQLKRVEAARTSRRGRCQRTSWR